MDMSKIMQQAQQFQQKMGRLQEELAAKSVISSIGGGMVTATMNGRQELLSIKIEKEVIDPDDPVMLQDLVVSAVNDVLQKTREMTQAEMAKLTGGINIPGLF